MKDNKASITFIINPISGTKSKDKLPELINNIIDKSRFDIKIIFTEYAGHASEIATKCADEATDICVAVGGDGTVNEVARSLIHSNTALGIIPCGSGNGLARHLCIPMNARKAIELINNGIIESFDYGIINEHPFFCTCGMGFDAYISMKFAEAGKRGLKTYVEKVLKDGLSYKPDTYIIDDGRERHEIKAFLIAIANASQYGNNAFIAPKSSMNDGLLDVIIMKPFNIIQAMTIGADMFAKTLDNNKRIQRFQTKHVTIHRQKAGAVHFDGDPTSMGENVDVRIETEGLKAVVSPHKIQDTTPPIKVIDAISRFIDSIFS